MKKLLFVIPSLEGSGGSERSLTLRVNYLVENFDYFILIVTTNENSRSSFYYLDSRVEVVNIPISFNKNTFVDKFNYVFRRSFKEEEPLVNFILKNQFYICSSLGSETLLYNHGKVKFFRIKENRFTYKKMLNNDSVSLYRSIWRFLRFRFLINVQRKMDCIITLTDEDRDFWSSYISNVLVMPNFINVSAIDSGRPFRNKSVIAVGRLEKEKDFQSLICAFVPVFQKFGDWRLEIYGDGSLKEELNELIFSLGLQKHVFLRGATSDIYSKYAESSIYAITSFYEGFGNATLEAISFGLPVVGFESVGGVKVLLKDSFNGFLINGRNIENFGKKIIQLIEDSALRESMGRNSRLIAEEFSEEKVMLKWHQFYDSILDK